MRFAVCLGALLAAGRLSAGVDTRPDRIDRLEQWMSAVARHDAGQQDAAVFEVAAFSVGDVQTLMIDAQSLVAIMRRPSASVSLIERRMFFLKSGREQRRIEYTPEQIERLRMLADAYRRREEKDPVRLLKRGARLESDVPMLGAHGSTPFAGAAPMTPSRARVPINDGESLGVHQEPMHRELARTLLDLVRPRPSEDGMVKALTGGSLVEIASTKDLGATFKKILDEFRQRYLVSYSPRGVAKDGWHRLEVRVRNHRATIKARPGYIAN